MASLGRGRLPEWSPDGETIAHRRGRELRTTSPDGGGRSVLATFPRALWGHINKLSCRPHVDLIRGLGPVWSPDGSQPGRRVREPVYVVDAETGRERIVQDPIQRGIAGVGAGVEWQPVPLPEGADAGTGGG